MAKSDNTKNTKNLIVVGVILALAAAIWIRNLQGSSGSLNHKWMFDFASQQLVKGSYSDPSPSDTSGQKVEVPGLGSVDSLIEVGIYSCGECSDVDAGMNEESLKAVNAHIAYFAVDDPAKDGRRIAAPGSKVWSEEMSGPGIALVSEAEVSCPGGERAAYCFP